MPIAIVTGASSGIGKEFIKHISQMHSSYGSKPFYEIWAIARDVDKLQKLQTEYKDERIVPIPLDLTSAEDLNKLQSILLQKAPEIGFLVQCAGSGKTGQVKDQSLETLREIIELNCLALAEITRICIPYMIPMGNGCTAKNGPRILHVASSSAFFPQPDFAAYAATKAFNVHFTRAIRHELRENNILITTVCPGPVDTPFMEHASGIPGSRHTGIKSYFVASPSKLVMKSIQKCERGKDLFVYGIAQKLLYFSSRILPHRFLSWVCQQFGKEGDPKTSDLAIQPSTQTLSVSIRQDTAEKNVQNSSDLICQKTSQDIQNRVYTSDSAKKIMKKYPS